MEKFKVKIPGGVYEIECMNKGEAITKAYEMYQDELRQLIESGDILKVPEVFQKIEN